MCPSSDCLFLFFNYFSDEGDDCGGNNEDDDEDDCRDGVVEEEHTLESVETMVGF